MTGSGWTIDLSGKTIVITGDDQHFQAAIAEQCAQAGAHIALVCSSQESAFAFVDKLAEQHSVKAKVYRWDHSDQKAINEIIHAAFTELGPIGGLVCNAAAPESKSATAGSKAALELEIAEFNNVMESQVWSSFVAAQACARLWKEHGYMHGKVVFISSSSPHKLTKEASGFYATATAALTGLTRSLAAEWGSMGITVNTLSPRLSSGEQSLNGSNPLGRVGESNEIVGQVVLLLSDRSSFATGSVLVIDGGDELW